MQQGLSGSQVQQILDEERERLCSGEEQPKRRR